MIAKKTSKPKQVVSKKITSNGKNNYKDVKNNAHASFEVIDPATLEKIGELPEYSPEMVEEKIKSAEDAFSVWSTKSLKERSEELLKFRKYLARHREEMIETMVKETGKTRMDALLEIFTVCEAISYIANKGKKILGRQNRSTGLLVHKNAYVEYKPYGVVGIISPWNYPLILSVTPIINALMAGNTVVIKPSEITPYTMLKTLEFFQKAGLTNGILQVVTGKGPTGQALVSSPNTKMICFTGSTATGRIIGEICGKMLKPVVLELGGKDPMIVFSDSDLKRAARGALWGGFFNSGQTCISVERVYVEKSVYNDFMNILKDEYKLIKQGTKEEFPSVGSMTFPKQVQIVEDHFSDARQKGANFISGGCRLEGEKGLFIEPSIVSEVSHDMKIMTDETFGPEIAIMTFSNEEEAIKLANDTSYGLNASVWTKDSTKARRVANQIAAGTISINDVISNYMISDLPFGGFKTSGVGRVHGPEGLRSFAQVQSFTENRWFWIFSKELWWFPYSKKIYDLLSKGIEKLFG